MMAGGLTEEQAAAVEVQARSWVGERYHDGADVRGGGIDCGMILVRAFVDAGVVEPFDPRPYPALLMLHKDDERYLEIVRRFARREFDPRQERPRRADIVVWQWGRTFSHGAIVTGNPYTGEPGWPWVVHAYADSGVVEEIDTTGSPMMWKAGKPRPLRAFSLREA